MCFKGDRPAKVTKRETFIGPAREYFHSYIMLPFRELNKPISSISNARHPKSCNNSILIMRILSVIPLTFLKVTDVSTSKTGKHGSAKCNFTAVDIFNGKKYQDIAPSTQTVLVPNVVRKEYTLVDISPDEFTTLMDEDGTTREDIKLPEWPDNYGREIKLKFEEGKQLIVIVWSAMGHDQIMSDREDAEAAKA